MATLHYVMENNTRIHKTFKSFEMARQFTEFAPGEWEYIGTGTDKDFPTPETYGQVKR